MASRRHNPSSAIHRSCPRCGTRTIGGGCDCKDGVPPAPSSGLIPIVACGVIGLAIGFGYVFTRAPAAAPEPAPPIAPVVVPPPIAPPRPQIETLPPPVEAPPPPVEADPPAPARKAVKPVKPVKPAAPADNNPY